MPPNESDTCELISDHDPADSRQRLELVREIVAMANASGGEIHLGIQEDGVRPGLDPDTVTRLDPARVQDLVDGYIGPDSIRVECRSEPTDNRDRVVVVIRVFPTESYPLVFTKSGEYEDPTRGSRTCFAKHSVYRRRGTKAEAARREDYRRWIDEAVRRENESWKSRVAILQRLPAGATVEIIPAEDEALDEPAVLLRRATRMFRRNPEKLLTKHELIEVFLVRGELSLSEDDIELLIHSALRRRPTLFFWLDLANPTADVIKRILDAAIDGSDRDKSDAGNAIVTAAALFLEDSEFQSVIDRLSASDYKHFREAAEATPDRASVIDALVAGRTTNLEGTPIMDWPETDLLAIANTMARPMISRSGYTLGRSRSLSRIGAEVFLRYRRPHLLS